MVRPGQAENYGLVGGGMIPAAIIIIIKFCQMSRGKVDKIERIEIYRDVGPVAHSETDGVCRAEVRAGVILALTPLLKVGGGSRGAKPSLED